MNIGHLNIELGWIFMLLGITSGSILGLWSFGGPLKPPKSYESYDSLPRRLTRLAHVACFMLPLINIVYGGHLDRLPISDAAKYLGSYTMIALMFGIPLFLLMASFKNVYKYLNIIPVSCGFVGLGIMAYGQLILLTGY